MLEALITSKTRIKLLVKFFLSTGSTGYLRGLSEEFNESTNAVRIELNRLEDAGLLKAQNKGNRKIFIANSGHPLFSDIQSIVRKYLGMDEIIDHVIHKLGDPTALYLIGDLAKGIDSPTLSLIIVGNDIHLDFLESLIAKAQKLVTKTIKYAVFTPHDFQLHLPYLDQEKLLKVWKSEQ